MSATSAPKEEARETLAELSYETETSASPPRRESAISTRRSDGDRTHPIHAAATDVDQTKAIKTEGGFLDPAVNSPNAEHATVSSTLRPAPPPSAKRRESEADLEIPECDERPSSKKRKRAASPPWTFPAADVSTLKTADGRRISARHNTSTPGPSETESRGRSGSQSVSRSRQASPPWRKFGADGPTTLQVDGKRKSGRVNKELTEQPKRVSPRSKKQADQPSMQQQHVQRKSIAKQTSMAGHSKKPQPEPKRLTTGLERPSGSSMSSKKIAELRAQIAALQPTRSFTSAKDEPQFPHKHKHSQDFATHEQPGSPPLSRKMHRLSNADQPPEKSRPSPKIKLRFTTPRQTIASPHPRAEMPYPARPPRLSLFQVIEQYELKEMQQPHMDSDRGPPAAEYFIQRAAKQATDEGAMRQRLLKEAEPEGALSRDHLSLYRDERQPEPPQQYGQIDHLVAHALYLRTLQSREKAQHRLLAKKLAHEALDRWKMKHGPTEEDVLAEQNKINELIKKQLVIDLKAMWEKVEAHVLEAKKKEWAREQEKVRAKKLQEKLEFSETLLARQRGEADSDNDMEEDSIEDIEESGVESEDEDEEAENMSDSDSEAAASNAEEDGEMDEHALAAYLAQREAEPPDENQQTGPSKEEEEAEDNLSSDESVEMYDSDEDMSSTGDEAEHANDDEDDDDDDEEDDDSGDDERPAEMRESLLALYSAKELLREKDGGLPTPMTSVENDGDNENSMRHSDTKSVKSDEQNQVTSQIMDELHEHHATMLDDQGTVDTSNVGTERQNTPYDKTQAEEEVEGIVEASDESSTKTLVPAPSLLRGVLRSYQHAGLGWLASLYRNGTNGILADEMGLGKTIQTISLLAHLAEVYEVWETHLVIVPTSVILNWVTEFQKFLPGFRVLGYYGTAEERQHKRRGWTNDPHNEDKDKRGYNVVITSYNVAMQDINALRNVQWHYLILDEAHNIRNFNSQRWQILIRLRTRARLLLTGTPLQNDLAEVWSLLTFLTAGDDDRSHGELEEFLSHWKDPVKEIFDQGVQKISENAQRVVDQLHVSLRPFLLRRKKSEVEKDLPKKTESVVVCKLSKRQRQLYQDYMGLAETKATLAKGSGVQAGAVLLSLRRVCNHPDLFDPRPIQTSFAMEISPLEYYSIKEQLIRKLLGVSVCLPDKFLVTRNEGRRRGIAQRYRNLAASRLLQRQLNELQDAAAQSNPDPSTLAGSRALQRYASRERKLQRFRVAIQATEFPLHSEPVYGVDLCELVTVHKSSPYLFSPRRSPNVEKYLLAWTSTGHRPFQLEHPGDWSLIKTTRLQQDIATLDRYAERLRDIITRFVFVPPAATVPILDFAIPRQAQEVLRSSPAYPFDNDWGHEARVRTSIAFPDSRLLIYDSGKLQRLVYLLRELQSKGSRSLIFTQMTGTLNVLEQFLNLLNLPYLRLDGSTPVERRQLYSAEFNRPDSKYQCMILSSRAGGVGLNLTGASSVIFYDLDWNPQMDRQCMDRAHRIGQVRDVEVYKMVSEKTVEENILRRANQKSLLDETVIQQGHFTTEYQQIRHREEPHERGEGEVAAAIERFLGGEDNVKTKAMESVEDKEDVQAAQQAAKEDRQDDMDFAERSSKGPSKANTPGPGIADEEEEEVASTRKGHIDLYMIRHMEYLLKGWQYVPAPVRKLDKHGRDPSHRPKRKR